MLGEEFFARPALAVAPELLGMVLRRGDVAIRLTEVEAYGGTDDPGSHAFRGRTGRNAVMFGGPGRLYTYFTYGMHTCANVSCLPAGEASGVLFRAGEVIEGIETARSRRTTSRADRDLASGPARLCVALGITLADGGSDLAIGPVTLELPGLDAPGEGRAGIRVSTGPRTGVAGVGGSEDFPWRFWIPGEDSVSPYRRHTAKKRS